MGIVSNFKKSTLPRIFNAFNEIKLSVTYKYKTGQNYVPGSGPTDIYTEISGVEVIRRDFMAEEIDNIIRAGDVQFVVKAESLGIDPEANAFFVVGTETWNIIRFTAKPIDSPVTYLCHCRLASK